MRALLFARRGINYRRKKRTMAKTLKNRNSSTDVGDGDTVAVIGRSMSIGGA